MHNNNLYIAEDFRAEIDEVDGSIVCYSGPTMQVGETETTIGLDLSTEDKPSMFIKKPDGDFTTDELRALIPVLQRVLHDMEEYEGVPHEPAF
jgi:hypothetical protein